MLGGADAPFLEWFQLAGRQAFWQKRRMNRPKSWNPRLRRAAALFSLLTCLAATLLVPARAAETGTPQPTLQPRCALPFQDNAVLQQKIPLPVWGTSLPDAKVTVTFDGQTKSTVANKDGKWRVVLDPLVAVKLSSVNEAPEGKDMVITCERGGEKAAKEIRNLVIGDVWICAGQSNMAGKMRTNTSMHFPEDSIAKANYPGLRFLVSPDETPWLICSPETAPEFKKVAFFFGRRVQQDALVPIGLIAAAVGGSNIESWLNQAPYGKGKNYGTLMEPIVGYGIRGAIWYQGESNEKDGREYLPKLRSLILGWRKAWDQPDSQAADGPHRDFSVYFVQLPGISESPADNPAGGDGRAEIRNAQFDALALPKTGMSVAIDVGAKSEHPPNKYDTGERLARWALNKDYGFKDLVPSGPLYKDLKMEGNSIRIRFEHAGGGLMLAEKEGFLPAKETPDAQLGWLSIQAKDGTWHWAEGKIDGAELIVSSPDVKEPIAVRYAYTQHPTGSLLYNREALPASPFSTCGDDPKP
jgi:sialate O-acetylesterase